MAAPSAIAVSATGVASGTRVAIARATPPSSHGRAVSFAVTLYHAHSSSSAQAASNVDLPKPAPATTVVKRLANAPSSRSSSARRRSIDERTAACVLVEPAAGDSRPLRSVRSLLGSILHGL